MQRCDSRLSCLPVAGSLTILPALLMEKCQTLSQGQSHPQGTSPVTGVLGQVVAQGALEKSGGKSSAHRTRGDHPRKPAPPQQIETP